jgi:peptide/nickel transport system substrate-binding protein
MTKRNIVLIITAIIFLLSACQTSGFSESMPTPVPPTATPLPPTELTVCVGTEPDSLYPYALSSQTARNISQTVFSSPFGEMDGQITPVILKAMPDFNTGTATLMPVSVREGDQVVNIYGVLITLQIGAEIFPSGCTSSACAVTWDGSIEIQMDQPTAIFNLVDGLSWSDGQAVTATDSVYSFELASDANTPVEKTYTNLTASYSALDAATVQWVGKPGLVTADFQNYFWLPLPQHVWGAYSAAELLELGDSTHNPVGWGPYMIEEWVPGNHIRLTKNPFYYRANEGLPKYDFITFKFITAGDSQQAMDGTCDLVSNDVLELDQLVVSAASLENSDYQLITGDSGEFEFLAFGINPVSYDDTYYPYGTDRPDIFGDVNTRKAIAMCIDREGIMQELTGGLVEVSDSYLSKSNALLSNLSLSQYPYDPTQGKALLDAMGWKDYDQNPATPLTMIATNTTVPFGTDFSITLYTSQSEMRGLIANKIASNLAECGIQVTVEQKSIQDLYLPGPDGVIFGRNFDLVLMSMDIGTEPDCKLFTTEEIPSKSNYWLGIETGGSNFMGYKNPAYDAACSAARSAGLDEAAYAAENQNALRVLSDDLPFIPFYHHSEFLLAKRELCLAENLDNLEKILFSIETLDPNIICQ